MATNYGDKILYGFSNIKIEDGNKIQHSIPGAISCQVTYSTNSTTLSNPTNSYTFSSTTTGEGTLEILSLSMDVEALLFGYKITEESNGMRTLEINDSPSNKTVGLYFTQKKANGKDIIYYFPSVTFSPTDITTSTYVNDSGIENVNTQIKFLCNKKNGILYKKMEQI